MKINNLFTSKVTYYKNRPIKYIVVHYTAGTTSKTGTAKNTANYFKTSSVEASADYVVDDTEVYCCNPDIYNNYTWAVGGNKYQRPCTSVGGTFYRKCTNLNSISVEICSNKKNKNQLGATDTDWYFTDGSLNTAIQLIKQLMKKHNVGIDNVIMHHHVTGKICPNPFCVNSSRLTEWQKFKNRLIEKEVEDMTEAQVKTLAQQVANEILKSNTEKIYNQITDVPEWGKSTVEKLVKNGWLKGDNNGNLDLTYTMLRILVILDRSGIFE